MGKNYFRKTRDSNALASYINKLEFAFAERTQLFANIQFEFMRSVLVASLLNYIC